jgi:hypothetical protein
MDEIHKLLGEVLKSAMLKMSHLEVMKAKLSKKLFGMKFNMEYLKSTTLGMHDYVTHGECAFKVLDCELDLLENKVCEFCVGCVCFNFVFFLMAFGALKFKRFILTNVYIFLLKAHTLARS